MRIEFSSFFFVLILTGCKWELALKACVKKDVILPQKKSYSEEEYTSF